MGRHLAVNTCRLDSFEGLHQAIQGSHVDVMQLGRGKFRGSLSHVGIGDFSLSIGSFSVGVRTQRVPTDDKLVVGMLLNAEDRVTHWLSTCAPRMSWSCRPAPSMTAFSMAPRPMPRSVSISSEVTSLFRANRD